MIADPIVPPMVFARRTRHGRRVIALLLLLAGWLGAVPALAATVAGITVAADRIVVRFDAPVARVSARSEKGGRVIALDLAGVDLPADRRRVAGARAAPTRGGTGTRLLVDLPRTAVVGDGGFDSSGRALTLELVPADAAVAARASLAGPLDFLPFTLQLGGRRKPGYSVVRRVPPAAKAPPLPRVVGEAGRPLVVIDAGHGGADPGAINPDTGLREKDVTLRIARAIRDRLVEGGRVRVALTRDADRFLVLRERYGIARRLHADLFISIHCDSVGSDEATGASVYTLSEVASDKEAARLAARENKADVLAGVDLGGAGADVSSILIDLTQRETMNNSADFARLLGREAQPLMLLKPNFHRMASLMVLKAPDLPSVLFETGYLSNPRDAAFLDSAEGRRRIADSVERAVNAHFARRMAVR